MDYKKQIDNYNDINNHVYNIVDDYLSNKIDNYYEPFYELFPHKNIISGEDIDILYYIIDSIIIYDKNLKNNMKYFKTEDYYHMPHHSEESSLYLLYHSHLRKIWKIFTNETETN